MPNPAYYMLLGIGPPGGGGGVPTSDPDFASVVLLVPWHGTDGQTTQTDLSNSAHTLTFQLNSQIDTAQSLEGGSSLLLDGNEDRVIAADSDDWHFGTGDFTVETFFRVDSFTTEVLQVLLSQWQTGGNERAWLWEVSASTMEFRYSTNGGSTTAVSGSFTFNEDNWYYGAVKRSGTSLTLHAALASNPTTTLVQTHAINADAIFNSTAPLRIGTASIGAVEAHDFLGWHNWTRITKGVARDVSNVPVLPLPTS